MYEYRATVDRVVDGDTVDLVVDLGFGMKMRERFRLYGINAPESRTKDLAEKAKGKQATARLIEILSGTTNLVIRTRRDSKGKFGRYLCILHDEGDYYRNINKQMVEEGYAVEYML